MNWIAVGIVVVLAIVLIYYFNTCVLPGEQMRVMPTPHEIDTTQWMDFMAHTVQSEDLFLRLEGDNDPRSVYSDPKERASVKKAAQDFFKKQFGLPDWYISAATTEFRINDKMKYTQMQEKLPIVDGGFLIPLVPGTTLRGAYGGSAGLTNCGMAVAVYGHYFVGDKYKINYLSKCPMVIYTTYDGEYMPVDCAINVESAPDQAMIGRKGKAQGIYRKRMIKDGFHHMVRNVVTFAAKPAAK